MEIKSQNSKSFLQFICYILVGSSNFILDEIILNTLWFISGRSIGTINYLFKLISFCIYSTNGYFLNKRYTFKNQNEDPSYIEYISLLALLSAVDAIIVSKFTTHNIFMIDNALWANICNLFACATTGIVGFLINKFVIFKKN